MAVMSVIMFPIILKNLLGAGSLVFVDTEQRQNQIMKLGVFELSHHGTPHSSPLEYVRLGPEEVLPVVSDVGEDSSETPHISRGGDVRISSEDLRGEIADGPTVRVGVVVHGGGGLA